MINLYDIVLTGIVSILLGVLLGSSIAYDNVNESCIKTNSFYVIDNVFTCKLKENRQ